MLLEAVSDTQSLPQSKCLSVPVHVCKALTQVINTVGFDDTVSCLDLTVTQIEGIREEGAEENVWVYDQQEAGDR